MALDIFTDRNFTIPLEHGAPICPVCEAALFVEVFEWWEETRLPTENGFHVWCWAQGEMGELEAHRDWDYDELLSAIRGVREWIGKEVERKRDWEICLWGKSEIPAGLSEVYY